MADTQIIPVEFQVDYSQLEATVDLLERTGKIDKAQAVQFKELTAELNRQQAALKGVTTAGKELSTSLTGVNEKLNGITSQAAADLFEGMNEELERAGISWEQFAQAIAEHGGVLEVLKGKTKQVGDEHGTLRTRIQNLREEMARVAQTSGLASEAYKKLEAEAGRLSNISRQVAKDVSLEGSDTRNIDLIVRGVGAVAAGFSLAQSATALFGKSSEDVQRILVKVSAAMGLANSIQQLAVELTAKGILTKIGHAAATGLEIAALKIYTAVTGKAAFATAALRTQVMLLVGATGIGLLVTLFIALKDAFRSNTSEAEKLDDTLDALKKSHDAYNTSLERSLELELARLRLAGATEKQLLLAQARITEIQIQNETQHLKTLQDQKKILDAGAKYLKSITSEGKFVRVTKEEYEKLNAEIAASTKNRDQLIHSARLVGFAIAEAGQAEAKAEQDRQKAVRTRILDDQKSIELAKARASDAPQSKILEIEKKFTDQKIKDITVSIQQKETQLKTIKETDIGYKKLHDSYVADLEERDNLTNESAVQQIDIQKAVVDQARAAGDKSVAAEEQRLEKLKAARNKELEDLRIQAETKVTISKEGSLEELQAKKDALKATLNQELFNASDSIAKQENLLANFNKEKLALDREYIRKRGEEFLKAEIDKVDTELAQAGISNERRLELELQRIQLVSELEVLAAEGNSIKIQAIIAERDKEIRDKKIQFLNDVADYEERLNNARNGPARRNLEGIINNENLAKKVRLAALDELTRMEMESLQKRINNNRFANAQIGADNKQLALEYAELLDEMDALTASSVENRNKIISESLIKTLEDINRIGSFILSQFQGIASEIAATENQALSEAQEQLDEMIEAGTISEKEAQARQKRLDVQEKKVRAEQAKRERALAIFRAILAIPEAFLEGLTTGGPPLAAIYAALAAAQLAIIVSRPPPKFAKGKKNLYEGPGIVGEQGYELIEREGGGMFLTKKPSLVYLGARDKVFTHKETTKILQPHVDKTIMNQVTNDGVNIDYDKLAKAILSTQQKQDGTVINIDKEFISESVASGLMKIKYFDRYYSSK